MSAIASPIELYALQQRQRMDSIRAATERERELLNERLASYSQGGSTPPPVPQTSDRILVVKERDSLRMQAESLGELVANIRQEEHELAVQEADVDRRLQRAADRKRDLLAQLKTVQMREEDLKNREAVADAKESSIKIKSEEVRVRHRDAQNQLATVKAEVSQREVLFTASLKKQNDKAAEQQRSLNRMRQQVADAEGRVRAMEMQINVRSRAIDDLERETMRSEMELREDELRTIEDLRRQVEDRKAALAIREVTASL